MKQTCLALVGLVVAASAAFGETSSEGRRVSGYVQPSAVIALPGEFDTAAGVSLAAGAIVNERHVVQVQAIWFES